jgi:tetratricopeptide (TPR) repeat protein
MVGRLLCKYAGVGAALAALLFGVPLSAQDGGQTPLPDLEAMSAQQVIELWQESGNRWLDQACEFGVPVTAALSAKTRKAAPAERASLYAQAICADNQQRFADGARLAEQLRQLTPETPDIGLSLYFARRLDDSDLALRILRGLKRQELGALDRDNLWPTTRMFNLAGRESDYEALALMWVESGDLAFVSSDLQESVALRALSEAVRKGQAEMVDPLLQSVTDPSSYIDLLTARRYEPIWPQVERRAGPNLSAIGDEHVQTTKSRLVNAPDDRDHFSNAARALYYNGQFKEATRLAQRWRDRKERGFAIEEGDGWALNIQAYSFDALGEPNKADALFDELASLDPEEHPWVVNFVINRASRLVGQGRWAEGLEASALARSVADKWGSDYARTIIARDHACALPKVGRADEANSELEYLRANWKEGIALAAQGLMCHGLNVEAAGILLEGLRDDRQRDRAIGAFMTGEMDLFYTPSILPDVRSTLSDNPELAAELARHFRVLPEAFTPRATLLRTPMKRQPDK